MIKNQKGFVHIFLILFLLAGLAGAVYLVQKKTNILPKAAGPVFRLPNIGFEFSRPSTDNFIIGEVKPVILSVRSDLFLANRFVAKINFDKDFLAVDRIDVSGSFINNWKENTFDNNIGGISLVGEIPYPGHKTDYKGDPSLMATIYFKAIKRGSTRVDFKNESAIYSAADNTNILMGNGRINISIISPPVFDSAESYREYIFSTFNFSENARNFIKLNSSIKVNDLSRDCNGGGLWHDEQKIVELNCINDEVAVHELSHVWWQNYRLQNLDMIKGIAKDVVRAADGEGSPVMVAFAKEYVYGANGWKGMYCTNNGCTDPHDIKDSDFALPEKTPNTKINDWEIYAGLSSWTMGKYKESERALPQYMWKYFEAQYSNNPQINPSTPTAPDSGDLFVKRPPGTKMEFTISQNVNCSYNNVTGGAVMISWKPVEPAVSRIEMDIGTGTTENGEPDIRSKEVKVDETATYAPIGFSGDPEIIPSKKDKEYRYYVRLYNGTYSEKQSFTIPSCLYTGN